MEEDGTTLMLRIIERGEVVPALDEYRHLFKRSGGLSQRRHVKAEEEVGVLNLILGQSNL